MCACSLAQGRGERQQGQCSGMRGFQGRDGKRHRTIRFCLIELEGEGLARAALGVTRVTLLSQRTCRLKQACLSAAPADLVPECQTPSQKHQKPESLKAGKEKEVALFS